MALITQEEVLKLARMSAITLTCQEVEDIIPKIEAVLSYAARVQELVPAGYTITQEYKLINVVRDDAAEAADSAALLRDAPQTEGNYFVVPAIIKQS